MHSHLYPKTPELKNNDFIKPSQAFKNSALKVVFSIVLFFLFYFFLVLLSAGILVASVLGWIALVSFKPNILTLAAGFGLVSVGVMLFIFLLKFVFSRTKDENPLRKEIKEEEQPKLFAFLKKLSEETNTPMPRKIFVSPDVNAAVFYNSGFWSMFFPVRKNLEIGLGLVNALNVSEFKSVLAHEFGHFAQSSMKIGSYIYTVNRAVFNLVYEYDRWDELLSKWAGTGGIFGFFAGVTFWLVEGIRNVLKGAYQLIHVNYMSLSREMEYHADLVAVSVSGNKPFISALRKIEFSSFAYTNTTGFLNALAAKGKCSSNLYENHAFTVSHLAKMNKLSFTEGEFVLSEQDLESSMHRSRVNVKDQWASHPSITEREENIAKVAVESEVLTNSAWELFQNAAHLQATFTQNMYQFGFPEESFESLVPQEFGSFVEEEFNKYQLSEKYNGFYDNRYLSELDMQDVETIEGAPDFSECYTREQVECIGRLYANKADLELLRQISLGQIQTKYFEFDGVKYKRKEARKLIPILEKEIEGQEKAVKELDEKSFQLNLFQAKKNGQEKELVEKYQQLFEAQGRLKEIEEIHLGTQELASQLYEKPRWTEEEIKSLLLELNRLEKELKGFLQRQDIPAVVEKMEDEAAKKSLQEYTAQDAFFIKSSEFDEAGFINLSNLVFELFTTFGAAYGATLKDLTDFQLQFELEDSRSAT